MNESIPYLGEGAALLAAIMWAIALAIFKAWGKGVSSVALNLAKNGIAVTGLLVGILFLHPPLPGADAPFAALVLSGIVGIAISDSLVLAGLSRAGTALTAASFCLSAPLAALLAWWWYGEKLTPIEILGVTVALAATAGAAWIGRGRDAHARGREFELGIVFLFLGQIANSVGIALGHGAFANIDVLYGTLVRSVPAIAVLLPVTLWRAKKTTRTPVPRRQLVMLALGCVIGTLIGLVLMSAGLKYARAGVAAALNATYPLWALPLSRIFLRERLTDSMVALILVAVGGITLLFLY